MHFGRFPLILGLRIDGKLKWGPLLATVKTKLESQKRGLNVIAGSTWGATLQKARQVYSAVVKPAMIDGAAIWHAPSGTTEQNECLRIVLGAYVLKAESDIPSMQILLDQAVLRMQALRDVHPVTKTGNARIRIILSPKKIKRHGNKLDFTPAERKERWALSSLRLASWKDVETPISNPVQAGASKMTRDRTQLRGKLSKWVEEEKKRTWQKCQSEVQRGREYRAQKRDLKDRLKLYTGPKKAESTLAIQMGSGKIGLAAFPHVKRVPGEGERFMHLRVEEARRQAGAYVLPGEREGPKEMLEAADTKDYEKLLSTNAGLKASPKWLMRSDLLDC